MPIFSSDVRTAVDDARSRGAGARMAAATVVAALVVAGSIWSPSTTDAFYTSSDSTALTIETRTTCTDEGVAAVESALTDLGPTTLRWSFADAGSADVAGSPSWGETSSFPCDPAGAVLLDGSALSEAITASGTTTTLALLDPTGASGDVLTLAAPGVVLAVEISGAQALLRTWTPALAGVEETPEEPAVDPVPATAAVTLATLDLDDAGPSRLVGVVVHADGTVALLVDDVEVAGSGPVAPLPLEPSAVLVVAGSAALVEATDLVASWDSLPASAASVTAAVDEVVVVAGATTPDQRSAVLAATASW